MIDWISIKDRLPKEYQKVLVGRDGADGVFGLISYKGEACNDAYWRDSSYNMFANPTHWAAISNVSIGHNE